jgi:hypothetical protein
LISINELRGFSHGDRLTIKVGRKSYDVWFEQYHSSLGLNPGFQLVTRCEKYPHLWRFFSSNVSTATLRERAEESTKPFPSW